MYIQFAENYFLRKPELRDVEDLYVQKNDIEVRSMLGGFSTGYSRQDLSAWIEFHRSCRDEVLWIIAEADRCLGHVGLYKIDHRIRCAEFAIMIGDKAIWGQGIGKKCTSLAVKYGFTELNLNRISLTVLASNQRAIKLYKSLGFQTEGILRQGQYKDGKYVDLIMMSLLREEYAAPN